MRFAGNGCKLCAICVPVQLSRIYLTSCSESSSIDDHLHSQGSAATDFRRGVSFKFLTQSSSTDPF